MFEVEIGLSSVYAQIVKQDPAYLSNQSRALHRTHHRNQRFLNFAAALWSAGFVALGLAGIVDQLVGLGWGFSPRDVWTYIGFAAFGGLFWTFATLIAKVTLRYIRHTYGPDPSERSDAPQ